MTWIHCKSCGFNGSTYLKPPKCPSCGSTKVENLQQRDLAYPIVAYKGTKLPKTDTITGISQNLATKENVETLVMSAECMDGHKFKAGDKIYKVGGFMRCPICGSPIQLTSMHPAKW